MKKNEQKSIQTLVDMIQAGSTQNELLDYLRSEENFGFLQFDNNTQTVYDDNDDYHYQTLNVVKMNKEVKKSFIEIPTKEEARYLMDIYYQMQDRRIALEGQLRAINQGKDSNIEEKEPSSKNITFMEWYLYNARIMENEIRKALDIFSDSHYISRWAKANTGIGPVIATCLAASLEIKKEADGSTKMHAGCWWNYCGLNDNNRPWIGKEKSAKLVNECIEATGGKLTDETIYMICGRTSWKIDHFESAKNKNGEYVKEDVINKCCMIPYNKKLKVLMYKIGHSFTLCKNKEKSLYGRLLKERLEYENMKNERGDYADQAAEILKSKNFNKSTDAYKAYIQGKLPPAHIIQRCERYVTKLFISHLFEAAYYNEYGCDAPTPYVLKFCEGHTDYIGPEVPYDSIDRD